MRLHRDHVAGIAIAATAAAVLLLSNDLPVGSLSMPGAGMMPKLVLAVMIVLALGVAAVGYRSPPLAELDWSDLPHALRVLAVAVPAVAVYTTAGFIVTMALLLFLLLFVVERRNVLAAAAFSIGVSVGAYFLFSNLLKTPLPAGVFGF